MLFWVIAAGLFVTAARIHSRRFLNHSLERHVMLGSNSAAILVLGRVVRNRTVHARNLDAHLAPLGANIFPTPRESLAIFLALTHPEGCGFRKNHLRQLARVLRFTENCQNHAWTILLHLYANSENI